MTINMVNMNGLAIAHPADDDYLAQYIFDGVNDYAVSDVTHGTLFTAATHVIVSGWFKLNADGTASASSQPLFCLPRCYGYVRETTNQVRIRYDNGGARESLHILGNGDRGWHHYVGVVYNNGSTWRTELYIDGVFRDGDNHAVAPNNDESGGLWVKFGTVFGGYFNGRLRDMRIFKFTSNTFSSADVDLLYAGSDPVNTGGIEELMTRRGYDYPMPTPGSLVAPVTAKPTPSVVVKFYDAYFGGSIIHQEILTRELSIEDDITIFSVAEFVMPIYDFIREGVKIEIYESTGNQDKLTFRGTIREPQPIRGQFDLIRLVARGEKSLMFKRSTLMSYDWVSQDISVIIGDLLDEYNTTYSENWTFYCDFEHTITLEDIKAKDEYYGIFDELAEETKSYWNIVEGQVIFSKQSGTDLTGSQIAEFNPLSPNPGNIKKISVVGTDTSGNIAIVEQLNGSITVDDSQFDGTVTGVVHKTVRNGDLASKAENFAEFMNKPQRVYQIEVIDNSIDANVGDTIAVDVVNTNSYFNYTGDAIVITKRTIYRNASKIVQYGIGEFIVSPFNIRNRQHGVEKTIKLLKLK